MTKPDAKMRTANPGSTPPGAPSSSATDPLTLDTHETEPKKAFDPYRFGANTMPPGLRVKLIEAELPVVPPEDLLESSPLKQFLAALRSRFARHTTPPNDTITAQPAPPMNDEPTHPGGRQRALVRDITLGVIVVVACFFLALLVFAPKKPSSSGVASPAYTATPHADTASAAPQKSGSRPSMMEATSTAGTSPSRRATASGFPENSPSTPIVPAAAPSSGPAPSTPIPSANVQPEGTRKAVESPRPKVKRVYDVPPF
ncbi:MAG TPA: hypothetical protein VHC69_18465 [Polyangiaceae bacterium]|nr:hypothetical protein [Polyangiaceae bacterium]